jgi:hypothetical protein
MQEKEPLFPRYEFPFGIETLPSVLAYSHTSSSAKVTVKAGKGLKITI